MMNPQAWNLKGYIGFVWGGTYFGMFVWAYSRLPDQATPLRSASPASILAGSSSQSESEWIEGQERRVSLKESDQEACPIIFVE